AALASVCTEARLAELDAGNLPTDIAAVKSTVDNVENGVNIIIQDTNELQLDWVNGGRLDLLLDAIPTTMVGTDNAALASVCTEARLVKLASLIFTKALELDVNTQSINGAAVVGDGNATPWDGA
ncbi:hypothetical protein LCGC14_2000090, partial [marine sediment metagenome]